MCGRQSLSCHFREKAETREIFTIVFNSTKNTCLCVFVCAREPMNAWNVNSMDMKLNWPSFFYYIIYTFSNLAAGVVLLPLLSLMTMTMIIFHSTNWQYWSICIAMQSNSVFTIQSIWWMKIRISYHALEYKCKYKVETVFFLCWITLYKRKCVTNYDNVSDRTLTISTSKSRL